MEERDKNQYLDPEERKEKRQAIIAALTRVTEDSEPLTETVCKSDDTSNEYYTFSHGEMEALIRGDIERIESWVRNLDRRHATWLLCRIIKENW